MPIYKGNTKVKSLYKGSTKIIKRYKGTDVIYRGLPSAYQEVEYIESSGTQYIDSGFTPNQDTRTVIDFSIVSLPSANASFFGARTSAFANHYGATIGGSNHNSLFTGYGNESDDTSITFTANTKYKIDENKNVIICGNQSFTSTIQTFSCEYTMYLFAMNQNGATFYNLLQLYSCKIYDNNVLVRDFVPCYRKSDNVIGLYDLVNGVFYTNAGTGTFVKGGNV